MRRAIWSGDTCGSLAVFAGVDTTAGIRKGCEEVPCGCSGSRKAGANLLTKLLETTLFRQEDKAIAEPQDRERRPSAQSEVFTELLGNGQLAFFADLGGREVLDGSFVIGHRSRKILPPYDFVINTQILRRYGPRRVREVTPAGIGD